MSQIESTLKARDVEEVLDIYFYRPLGYGAALIGRALRLTPNALTILSIVIGMAGGYLFYFRSVVVNAWGIFLWVVADILDSADGQLARMTNNKSKLGRILDGFATNLIFTVMYFSLYFRMIESGLSPWWGLLILFSGLSHSMQSALADYYRNAYLRYVVDPNKSELHRSEDVQRDYDALTWSGQFVQKFFLRLYLNYTIQQETVSRNFQKLRAGIERTFGGNIPQSFRDEYRRKNKPLLKYYNIMTTNTRMIAMSVCVLIDKPLLYFFVEAVLINAVMIGVTFYQESLSAKMLRQLETEGVFA